MKIRSKVIMITLPLIITPLVLSLLIAVFSSRNGITNVAKELLSFKSKVLTNYVGNQWDLLVDNNLEESEEFISVSQSAIQEYSRTLLANESERIFAIDGEGEPVMMSSVLDLNSEDKAILKEMHDLKRTGWQEIDLHQLELIAYTSLFEPFQWFILVSVEADVFYDAVNRILFRISGISLLSLIAAAIALLLFSNYLTRPIQSIVNVIGTIIETNDLSAKVSLKYQDEIGELGHFFNIMTEELEMADKQIKSYALQAVIARRKEMKIRNIFQKYVPKNVIDMFFENPEGLLEGDNRVLGVLFSDIRSFTSFSEKLPPDEVVQCLNKYFEIMVDVISGHGGIVDKYIGDAIMAFFGAPVHHDNDALQSVEAGLDMIEGLKDFNQWQKRYGRDPFAIGVGINYGVVTVGNIGSDKKMDYTVIGDMVNLASRLEGLTKLYKEPLIISDSIYRKVSRTLSCRLVDKVIVKGKSRSTNIYSAKRNLSPSEKSSWESYEKGISLYYEREFLKAQKCFSDSLSYSPDDYCSEMFRQRCEKYKINPPDEAWTGDTVLNRK